MIGEPDLFGYKPAPNYPDSPGHRGVETSIEAAEALADATRRATSSVALHAAVAVADRGLVQAGITRVASRLGSGVTGRRVVVLAPRDALDRELAGAAAVAGLQLGAASAREASIARRVLEQDRGGIHLTDR